MNDDINFTITDSELVDGMILVLTDTRNLLLTL